MATLTLPNNSSFLNRNIVLGITPAHILVVGIMFLSGILHFSNLSAINDANTYYTAAVESMLQSWSNFFFVAAEPGGSVTVDKPPLGLWIEAAFAFVLGVEGWVVSLPNILSGIFSIPLLYHLVKKYAGVIGGLVAALVLVVTPVAIATDRNNTMDGMLVFSLLLAAWTFILATETGKLHWLLLGAFIVGLGFNIKMLQAFLPLPAFYALYFLGSKTGWFRKIFYLGITTIILLMVSLSWAVVVDMTPADQRPYIGSSDDNTVMELIVGHNGLSRLFGGGGKRNSPQDNYTPASRPDGANTRPIKPPPQKALTACLGQAQNSPCSITLPGGDTINGNCFLPPGTNQLACAPQLMVSKPPTGVLGDGSNASPDGPQNTVNSNNTPFSHETGSPGVSRFFKYPLSKQMSWQLPFALVSIILLIFAARIRIPLEPEHKALLLWGGWLLTCLVFFSSVEGIFHAYYAIMLAPALGAVVGGGFDKMWRWQANRRWVSTIFVISTVLTISFQIFTAAQYGVMSPWVFIPLILLIIGTFFLLISVLWRLGYLTMLTALLVIPLIWTVMTVFDATPKVNLPTAYDGQQKDASQPIPPRVGLPGLNERNEADEELVAFLQANTQDTEYMVAVPNSHIGSPLVLATGRPVLYIGGFGGGDSVIDATGLAEMVSNGELRYVISGGEKNNKKDIANWLASSCTQVSRFSQGNNRSDQFNNRPSGPNDGRPGGRENQPTVLYQCG